MYTLWASTEFRNARRTYTLRASTEFLTYKTLTRVKWFNLWLTFAYVNTRKKSPTEIDFQYLGNKEMYCIFKTHGIISLYLPQNAIYSILLSCFVQIIIMFFINHALKFKYIPGPFKFQATPFTDNSLITKAVVPVHFRKAYMGNRSITPLILNLSTRWRWVVNPKKEPQHPFNRRLSGPHGWSGCFGEDKNKSPALTGFELQTVRPTTRLLDRLHYPSSF